MSVATTRGVRVEVIPTYHADRSRPQANYWFFSYRVRVSNEGEGPVQLLSRHWIITDATGHRQDVRGPGVVGHQPLLEPGQNFEYTSFCPLPTSMGTMHGSYRMLTPNGEQFDAEIAPFTLVDPLDMN